MPTSDLGDLRLVNFKNVFFSSNCYMSEVVYRIMTLGKTLVRVIRNPCGDKKVPKIDTKTVLFDGTFFGDLFGQKKRYLKRASYVSVPFFGNFDTLEVHLGTFF